MSKTHTDISLLVVSCDKYSDLWVPFFQAFNKFWKECAFPRYLLTNEKDFYWEDLSVLKVGEDVSWSDNLIKCINQIDSEYILLFLDDLFITNFVNNEHVGKVVDWILVEKPNHFRFYPSPPPNEKYNTPNIGVLSKGSVYRTSTVLSLWKKEVLLDLLMPGENAWEFEEIGSIRSDPYDKFYASKKTIIPIMNSVIRGMWRPDAINILMKNGFQIDVTKRAVMSFKESCIFKLKVVRAKLFYICPTRYRRSLKSLFRSP